MRYLPRTTRSRPQCRVDSTRPTGDDVRVTERDVKRLGAAVVSAREALGMTQEEFAVHCELGLSTVQRVEAGTITPRAKTYQKLDKGCGWEAGSARALVEYGRRPASGDRGLAKLSQEEALRIALELEPTAGLEFMQRWKSARKPSETPTNHSHDANAANH